MNLSPEEIRELKDLLPSHLHRWIGYVPSPEPEDEPTPEERRGMARGTKPIPAALKAAPAVPGAKPERKAKAEFRGLQKAHQGDSLAPDVQRVLLDLALSDEDDDAA